MANRQALINEVLKLNGTALRANDDVGDEIAQRAFRKRFLEEYEAVAKSISQFFNEDGRGYLPEQNRISSLLRAIQDAAETMLGNIDAFQKRVVEVVPDLIHELEMTFATIDRASGQDVAVRQAVEKDVALPITPLLGSQSQAEANPYQDRTGFRVQAGYVVATSESAIRHFNEAGAELRNLLRELGGPNEEDARRELGYVMNALESVAKTLENEFPMFHQQAAQDAQSWVERLMAERWVKALGLVATLWGIFELLLKLVTAALGGG